MESSIRAQSLNMIGEIPAPLCALLLPDMMKMADCEAFLPLQAFSPFLQHPHPRLPTGLMDLNALLVPLRPELLLL